MCRCNLGSSRSGQPCARAGNGQPARQALADTTPDVTFVGRLAAWRYDNMDQVLAQALSTCARIALAQALSTCARIAKEQGRAFALSQTEPTIVLRAGAT
jgi:hypothetical protein